MSSSTKQEPPQAPESTSVVLLAAGHGSRMRPLTNTTPKPLLKVGERSLIEHHIIRLRQLGFKNIVINTAYLGHKIQRALGNGHQLDVDIQYSDESETGALETAGGIKKSLRLIKSDPFIAINADIYTDYNFTYLLDIPLSKAGHLVLVPNPPHNPLGDFSVGTDFGARSASTGDNLSTETMTFSGIALYRKAMFDSLPDGKLALGPIIKTMNQQGELEISQHFGAWTDVGTPQRLAELNSRENPKR